MGELYCTRMHNYQSSLKYLRGFADAIQEIALLEDMGSGFVINLKELPLEDPIVAGHNTFSGVPAPHPLKKISQEACFGQVLNWCVNGSDTDAPGYIKEAEGEEILTSFRIPERYPLAIAQKIKLAKSFFEFMIFWSFDNRKNWKAWQVENPGNLGTALSPVETTDEFWFRELILENKERRLLLFMGSVWY